MIYKGNKTKNISFPLGGIGTGCVGLSGNGELIDWEIFNRPSKGTKNGYSHFAVKATDGKSTVVKVLHGDTNDNYMGEKEEGWFCGLGFGVRQSSMAGYPHFKSLTFDGTFPVAHLTYEDSAFPGVVRLCAYNPFIPNDEDNSSMPCAIFKWEIENTSGCDQTYTIAFTVQNPAPVSINREFTRGKYRGAFLENGGKDKGEVDYFDLTVMTDCENATVQENWYRGGWQDGVTTYWKNLCGCDTMPKRAYDTPGKQDHATVTATALAHPGEKKEMTFILAWSCPINYCYWDEYKNEKGEHVTWKNYYATVFESSLECATHAFDNLGEHYEKTEQFAKSIQEMSLPAYMIDAVSANLSVLKTPVTLRLEDASLWGWEGLHQTKGSCDGSCQHVWNYAYAVPYLFPRLERTLRENTMKYAANRHGGTAFRVRLPLGREPRWGRACVDGQMGEVIKCYREWKISGDNSWLEKYAESIFKMVEYAWSDQNPDAWDRDMDGVLEGRQHHTLDMELFGPSSWLEGFYLLALDCAAQMAQALNQTERAKKYRGVYEKGKKWVNESLFNGEYFYHKIDLKDKSIIDAYPETEGYWNSEAQEIKYQVAQGSIIDQMLSDWHAAIIGCEPVFDREKKKTALDYLFKNNFKPSMREVTNMWRNFAVNDEGGVLICTYPNEKSIPAIPIPYCEEVMTGFEYALSGLMLAEGKEKEAETIVKAIRDRYDGEKRNPWSEIECGSNYARSMASYAFVNLYSGFVCDATRSYMGFYPKKQGKYPWSAFGTWGQVELTEGGCVITVHGDPLKALKIGLCGVENGCTVKIDGQEVACTLQDGTVALDRHVLSKLEIKYN